jgi:hypothetical protein
MSNQKDNSLLKMIIGLALAGAIFAGLCAFFPEEARMLGDYLYSGIDYVLTGEDMKGW